MKCPCGAVNPAQARFCMTCGAKLVNGIICNHCQALLPPEANFCYHCGTYQSLEANPIYQPAAQRQTGQEIPIPKSIDQEQITESPKDSFPIVSGVMMTNELGWTAPDEDGIIHITASWGFANGTNNKTVCDEWVISDDNHDYATIRRKPYRIVPESLGTEKKILNPMSILPAIPQSLA